MSEAWFAEMANPVKAGAKRCGTTAPKGSVQMKKKKNKKTKE